MVHVSTLPLLLILEVIYIKDSLDTNVSKICSKYKQTKSHKLKQIFSNSLTILIIIINRLDNNNRKLNNLICNQYR